MNSRTVASLACVVLCCLVLAHLGAGQGEERHSRVGDPRYWTQECFLNCYKVYLGCIGKIFPAKLYNNEQMVEMFRDKSNGFHELIEGCSAKYHETIHIEDDIRRTAALQALNNTVGLTSNFDLCVFSQCGAGGYYGSFNVNHMKYTDVVNMANKRLDPVFDFYFEMNST